MEYYNGILAVDYRELTSPDSGEAVMSGENYKKLKSRSSITVLRPGKGLGHPALIEWSSMPTRFKEKFISKYGDPEKIMLRMSNMLTIDESAREYYSDHVLASGEHLKAERIEEYTLNASVLNKLIDNLNHQKAGRNKGGNRTPICWGNIVNECESLRDQVGHTLPKSEARIKDKIREYQQSGYGCLISGKNGNQNTSKMTPEAQEWLIHMMRTRYPRMTVQSLFAEYNRIAEGEGWKQIRSEQTLRNFLFKEGIMQYWQDTKVGELAIRARLQRQNMLAAPSLRDSLWYGDGTVINLYYKAYVGGKYKAARVWVYEVADASTECLIGYHICPQENFEAMYKATVMALQTAGHKPYEYVYDHQGGTKQKIAQMWLKKVAHISRYCAPHHGNSKTIESIFGRFQNQVLSKLWFYSGGNNQATSLRAQIDTEYITKNIDALPTYTELVEAYRSCREQWNAMPMANAVDSTVSRWQVYSESVNPKTAELSERMMRDMRMIFCARPIKLTQQGICFTLDKCDYCYEVLGEDGYCDHQWLTNHIGMEFNVEYDPSTLGTEGSSIRLYRDCGKNGGLQYMAEASRKRVVPRAMQEQTEDDRRYLMTEDWNAKRERVRLQLERLAIDAKFNDLPEDHGCRTPKLQGISDSEFERLADEIRTGKRRGAEPVPEEPQRKILTVEPQPYDTMADSIGAANKAASAKDRLISYLDRL